MQLLQNLFGLIRRLGRRFKLFAQSSYRRRSWQRHRAFWQWRHQFRKNAFRVKRWFFRQSRRLQQSRNQLALAQTIGKIIVGRVLFAVLIVGGLALWEEWLTSTWPVVNQLIVEAIGANPDYTGLLRTIVAVVGIFLGLYMTALSVLASTVYGDVTANLRKIVLKNKVGNLAFDLLVFLLAACLLLLAVDSFGWSAGIFNLALVSALSVVGVFSFGFLLFHTLRFLEPTAIAGHLQHRILEAATAVASKGFDARDPSFQHNYRREAATAVDTYEELAKEASQRRGVSAARLSELAKETLGLYSLYAERRPNIPPESYWYQRSYEHPSWLTASHAKVSTALTTYTTLQPDKRIERDWLETRLEGILELLLSALIKQQDWTEAADVAWSSQSVVEDLAEKFQMAHAVRLHRKLADISDTIESSAGEESGQEDLSAARLAVHRSLLRGPPALVVGFGSALLDTTSLTIESLAVNSATKQPNAPIGTAVPDLVQSEIALLRRSLDFERASEGQRLTPNWYLSAAIADRYVASTREVLQRLPEEIEHTYIGRAEAHWNSGRSRLALHTVQSGLETCSKLEYHLSRYETVLTGWDELRSPVFDGEATSIDWESLHASTARFRDALLIRLAMVALTLPTDVPSGDLPDDTGYAYSLLANECYFALAEGRTDLFSQLFPSYFRLLFPMLNRSRIELKDYRQEAQVTIISDLITDLLTLSGYALVGNRLRGWDVWEPVKELWDTYLRNASDAAEKVNFAVACAQHRQTAPSMTARGLQRTSWWEDFSRRLREAGLMSESLSGGGGVRAEPIDPAVRALLKEVFPNPHRVFLSEYLLRRPEAANVQLSRREQVFQDEIRREAEQQAWVPN